MVQLLRLPHHTHLLLCCCPPLIRQSDPYFPQFRSFDWFCGHSWARGLLFAYDGKDQVCLVPFSAPTLVFVVETYFLVANKENMRPL